MAKNGLGHFHPIAEHSSSASTDDIIEITLTNPGIISRLREDIDDYLSPFGYRLTPKSLNPAEKVSGVSAVLTVPLLPRCDPLKILYVSIHEESFIHTIGPLLRTYLRLSRADLHPKRLRAVVDCQFVLNSNDHDALDNASRRMVHHVHMVVRNSMGSALCLELMIILPFYSKERKPLLTCAVKRSMKENSDACYPCVTLIPQNHSEFDACTSTGMNTVATGKECFRTLQLHVRTRMCTVRHQPRLFRWLSSSAKPSVDNATNDELDNDASSMTQQSKSARHIPIVIACIEKVANLHRILMLCHEYDKARLFTEKCSTEIKAVDELLNHDLLLRNVVVVMPRHQTFKEEGQSDANSDDKQSKRKTKRSSNKSLFVYFEEAVQHFHAVVFCGREGNYDAYRPLFVYEDEVMNLILNRHPSPNEPQSIVGIDMHPLALTLHGDRTCHCLEKHPCATTHKLLLSDFMIFGYESSGIPYSIQEKITGWVEIPCRSSINVVAAMSIILDALLM